MARFEREAKTLASLNHPHIAAIYGFEKSAGMHAPVRRRPRRRFLINTVDEASAPITLLQNWHPAEKK